MKNFINNLNQGTKLVINNEEYEVLTKTYYTIEEDESVVYIKCEISANKVLVIIPEDNYIYFGKVIEDMEYERISDDQIKYEGNIFNKTGDGHQYIINIEFGTEDEVEGRCIFEDYESEKNVISLGILTDKDNIRADVYADILSLEDIAIKE